MDFVLSRGDIGRRLSSPRGMPRPKRKVQDNKNRFPGWTRLKNLYNKCPSREHEVLFLVLFHSGARVSEAIQLQHNQCAWNSESFYFFDTQVLKQRNPDATRNAYLPRDPENPLIQHLVEYVADCDTKYLLPGREPFTGEIIPDKHTSRSTVYRKLQEIDRSLFPHLLRGWCAGMLVEQYGFDVFDLQGWFSWISSTTPSFYARTREQGLKAKLGIKEAPTRQ